MYTSELIPCSTICVHSATRHNIHMYHGRWIDSVWKSHSYAGALKENPINLTLSESLIVVEYNPILEIF